LARETRLLRPRGELDWSAATPTAQALRSYPHICGIENKDGRCVVGEVPLSNGDLTATNAAFFTPGIAGSGLSMAANIGMYALRVKKFGIFVSQNPAALAATRLLNLPLQDLGYTTVDSAVTPTATDYTSSVTALKRSGLGFLTTHGGARRGVRDLASRTSDEDSSRRLRCVSVPSASIST
jgi:hypothetical protein